LRLLVCAWLHLTFQIVINGATFLVSTATLLFVHIPPREAPETTEGDEEEGWLSETLAGSGSFFGRTRGCWRP
jgi:hypothetical protein